LFFVFLVKPFPHIEMQGLGLKPVYP